MRRYLTTRPSRATLILLVLGIAMLLGSAFAPGERVTHVIINGHDVPQSQFGWQSVVVIGLRIGGVAAILIAALLQQKRVETIDDLVREEAATIAYDRTAGVDARGNSAVNSAAANSWRRG